METQGKVSCKLRGCSGGVEVVGCCHRVSRMRKKTDEICETFWAWWMQKAQRTVAMCSAQHHTKHCVSITHTSRSVLLVEITVRITQTLCGQNVPSSLMLNYILCVITSVFKSFKDGRMWKKWMLDACFNGSWLKHLTGILSNDVGVLTGELSAEHCNWDKKSWYTMMTEETKYKPNSLHVQKADQRVLFIIKL